MTTMVSRTLSVHKEHEVLLKLEAAGLDDELAQRVIDSKENFLAQEVVRLIENFGFEPSTSQKRAREIVGRNFFGFEDAIKHFGVVPSKEQIAYLAEVPFTEKTLESVKDTHILVAVFPLSILDLWAKFTHGADRLLHDLIWYHEEQFAKDRGEIGWRLVRKNAVPGSTSKTWGEQQTLLNKNEETPSAQVMVYTIIGHYLATGERLFKMSDVRTDSVAQGGHRPHVGDFGRRGLNITCWRDDYRDGGLGVASARKS